MPISFPFPVRVSVGLAVAGVEQLRKLPGELPSLGVTAAGQAMRLSMRLQQEFADLAIRGDEVLSLVGGQPPEHPAWATFDDEDADATTTLVAVVDAAEDAAIEDEDGYSGGATQELAEVIALDLVAAAHSVVGAQDDEPDAGSPIAAQAATDTDTDTDSDSDSDSDQGLAGDEALEVSTTDPDAEAGVSELDVQIGAQDHSPATGTSSDLTDDGAVDPQDNYDALTLAELRGRLRRLSADQVTELLGRERAGADRPAFVTLLSNRLTSMEQSQP